MGTIKITEKSTINACESHPGSTVETSMEFESFEDYLQYLLFREDQAAGFFQDGDYSGDFFLEEDPFKDSHEPWEDESDKSVENVVDIKEVKVKKKSTLH